MPPKGWRGVQNKPYNYFGAEFVIRCPTCGETDRQIKVGRMPSGSQRYRCRHCGKKYTPKAISPVRPSGLVGHSDE